MKPVKADTLLKLDPLQKVEMIRCTPNPQQLVYMGGKNDYSELPIEETWNGIWSGYNRTSPLESVLPFLP